MALLTLVVELSNDEGQAGEVMNALVTALTTQQGCAPIAGFKVHDLGVGNLLPLPAVFTTTETKETP